MASCFHVSSESEPTWIRLQRLLHSALFIVTFVWAAVFFTDAIQQCVDTKFRAACLNCVPVFQQERY